MAGPYDLTGQNIENTYQRIIQTPDGATFYDGTGSLVNVGTGGVTKIIPGSGILVSPSSGVGNVTVTNLGTSYNTMTGSYGSFYDTGSQTAIDSTIIYSMSLSTTDISNGVYISGSDKTKIYFTNAGIYNFQFSSQFTNSDNAQSEISVWLRKNDDSPLNDLPDTTGQITIPARKSPGIPGEIIAGWNYFINLAEGDFLQLLWRASTSNVVSLQTLPSGSTPKYPRTPALIVTAHRVDTFLSNTGSFSGSFTGQLIGTASWAQSANITISSSYALNSTNAITASYALNTDVNINTGSFATTGSNIFIGNQTITGSLNITGSVIADNLWYRWTLTNLPLNTGGTYTIVPVTPGYKFVQAYYVIGATHIPLNTSIENNSNSSITISNPIHLGTPSNINAIWKFDAGSLGANEIFSKWNTIGDNIMIDISSDPIIVTIDGSGGDTGVIDVTVTGYLKKI